MKLHVSYSAEKTTLVVRNETVEVKPYQIILMVSLSVQDVLEWDSRTPIFPAILDTGNNHNFSISEEHLVKWAGIQPDLLGKQRSLREGSKKIPLRAASLWLQADQAFRLDMDEGIAVFPEGGPRLPLLGLRALTRNKLRAFIYGEQQKVILRTSSKWYWPY